MTRCERCGDPIAPRDGIYTTEAVRICTSCRTDADDPLASTEGREPNPE